MQTLDVFKKRRFNVIHVGKGKEVRDLKVPLEYTVEEVERLLELHTKRDAIEETYVSKTDQKAQEEVLQNFWGIVFDQLEIIFQHYQPEITAAELRGLVSHKEALDILGFYEKYRYLANEKSGKADEAKKKV